MGVATSRARLGLYVFGRAALFKNCYELQPTFNQFLSRPLQLHLCPNEVYPSTRKANVVAPNPIIVRDTTQMCKFVYDFYANKVAAMQQIMPAKSATDAAADGGGTTTDKGKSSSGAKEEEPVPEVEMKELVNEVAEEGSQAQ